MKREEAIALVEAMFGSKQKSSPGGNSVMNSPKVQQVYSEAFGEYPPIGIVDDDFWAVRLREIADAIDGGSLGTGNRCSECDGKGEIPRVDKLPLLCEKCRGVGWIVEQASETYVVSSIKNILAHFGILDSQGYVQATIHLDYDTELVGVSIKKKMFAYANNTTTGKRSDKV